MERVRFLETRVVQDGSGTTFEAGKEYEMRVDSARHWLNRGAAVLVPKDEPKTRPEPEPKPEAAPEPEAAEDDLGLEDEPPPPPKSRRRRILGKS